MQPLQRSDNPARVLRANPVHLEAIGDEESQARLGRGKLGRQGLDPGVELLLWQLLRQRLLAGGPQPGSGGGWGAAQPFGGFIFVHCPMLKHCG